MSEREKCVAELVVLLGLALGGYGIYARDAVTGWSSGGAQGRR